MSLPGSLHQRT